MVTKVAKVGAVKTERNWSRSERKVGVSCMCGLLVARDPGGCATPRIHPSPKEDAIEHAHSSFARSAKSELRFPRYCRALRGSPQETRAISPQACGLSRRLA